MERTTNHNSIYFLTTLSVYLGLVLVGASPQILSQAKIASDAQTRVFEFSTRSGNSLSRLKHTRKFQSDHTLSFPFAVMARFPVRRDVHASVCAETAQGIFENIAPNDQVFTLPRLPRASI